MDFEKFAVKYSESRKAVREAAMNGSIADLRLHALTAVRTTNDALDSSLIGHTAYTNYMDELAKDILAYLVIE